MTNKIDRGAKVNEAVLEALKRPAASPSPSPAPPAPGRQTASAGARTWVGRVANEHNVGLKDRIAELELERAEGRVVLELDPKRVRFGQLANRDERSLDVADEAFRELKTDLAEHGQEFPIKVRAVADDPDHEYEVVAGHRRLRAALQLDAEREGGFRVLAILDAHAAELKTIALKMYRENKVRSDLTPYEYGRTFRKWIDAGVFRTQQEIAAATRLSQPTVSFYLGVYELPIEVHAAFGDPRSISMRWMQALAKQLKAHESGVLERARELAAQTPRLKPEAVYSALMAPFATGKARATPTRSDSFKLNNKVIYTFGRKDGRFTVKLGRHVERGLQKELADELQEFLRGWLTKRIKGE